MINLKKCPLCSGSVKDGICVECGYSIPEEDELDQMSQIYNLEPEDYPQEQFYDNERYPGGAEQIQNLQGSPTAYAEPERDAVPNIRVVPSAAVPPPVGRQSGYVPNNGQHQQMNGMQGGYVQNNGQYQQVNGIQNGYAQNNGQYQQVNNQQSGYVPNYQQNSGQKSGIDTTKLPWGKLILSLIFPFVGIVFGIILLRKPKIPEDKLAGKICLGLGILKFFTL